MANLTVYLDAASRRPFQWGELDCLLFVADWIRDVRGIDCAASFRGTYGTERQCLRILRRHGGLLRLMQHQAGEHGFRRTDAPQAGDAGVMALPVLRKGRQVTDHFGALFTGTRWAIKSRDGMAFVADRAIAAWSV